MFFCPSSEITSQTRGSETPEKKLMELSLPGKRDTKHPDSTCEGISALTIGFGVGVVCETRIYGRDEELCADLINVNP